MRTKTITKEPERMLTDEEMRISEMKAQKGKSGEYYVIDEIQSWAGYKLRINRTGSGFKKIEEKK